MPRWPSPSLHRRERAAPSHAGVAPCLLPIEDLARVALPLARAAIARRLHTEFDTRALDPPVSPWLDAPGAAFVTLTVDGRLRGCIGTVVPHRPLRADIVHNAESAALRDRRFPPLSAPELAGTRIEVSLLSPSTPLSCSDEAHALAQLRPGVDGVVLECGDRRAVFLPQVWAQLPEPAEFLGRLKAKAGLPEDYWSRALALSRFTVREMHEEVSGSHDV